MDKEKKCLCIYYMINWKREVSVVSPDVGTNPTDGKWAVGIKLPVLRGLHLGQRETSGRKKYMVNLK